MTSVPNPVEHPVPQENRPRFGQLIYTSFDDQRSGGGGWRVKEDSGDLSPTERQELTSRIVTNFDVGEALPPYPNDDQIANRPARLMYGALKGGRAGYWHTVDAGKDATGRPNNVLAHVVLDRDITVPSELRPIELWGSPHWLRAYGAAEVAAARLLSPDYPQPTGEICCASVVRFLTGMSVDQQIVFRVLLDSVYWAMNGGRGVILTMHEPRQSHWWIAGLSYFMSPGSARKFTWSTYDDPHLAAADMQSGLHLVVVAADRSADLPHGKWLVLDDHDRPYLGAVGSTHGTSGGEVEVTSWSLLAEAVLADAELAERLIDRQDAIAAEVGDRDLSPVWPLAVAVRKEPLLSEFHHEADKVIADEAPIHCGSVQWIGDLVRDATTATAPVEVESALSRLISAQKRSGRAPHVVARFADLALADDHWISSGPLVQVPIVRTLDVSSRSEAVKQLIRDVLGSGVSQANGEAGSTLHVLLRLVDLLDRIAAPSADLDTLQVELMAAVNDHVSELGDMTVARSVMNDPGIRPDVRERFIRPAVARLSGPVLEQFDVDVWRWLFDARPGELQPLPNPPSCDPVLLPRYILAEISSAQALHAGYRERLAADAIAFALGADDLSDQDCRTLLRKLAAFVQVPSVELVEYLRRWPTRVPPALATSYLLCDSVPDELLEMIAAHKGNWDLDPDDQGAVAAAWLRRLYIQPKPWRGDEIREAIEVLVPAVARVLNPDLINFLYHDLAIAFCAMTVCKDALNTGHVATDAEVAWAVNYRVARNVNDVAEIVADAVEAGVVEVNSFVAEAFIGRLGFDHQPEFPLAGSFDRRPELADRVVRNLIDRKVYCGPDDPQGLRDAAWPLVSTLSPGQAEKFFRDYQHAAREWLSEHGIGGDQGGRLRFRRTNRED